MPEYIVSHACVPLMRAGSGIWERNIDESAVG